MADDGTQPKSREMRLYSETGNLRPVHPFDFAKSISFLESFAPMKGEQSTMESSLTKAVSICEKPIAFHLQSIGKIEAPMLKYTLFSDRSINARVKEKALDRIAFFLSLDDDLKPFYEIGRADSHFRPILERLYGYHQVKFLTPFEGTCWAIMTQRNAVPIAKRHKAALAKSFGKSIEVNGTVYTAFPEPNQMLRADPEGIMAITRNRRRSEYLISAAGAFKDIDESFLRTGDYDEVSAWLDRIKGIGPWSAAFIMLRSLGRMEKFPLDEWSLIEAASLAYGRKMDQESVQKIADKYSRWQGYWAHYLRIAL